MANLTLPIYAILLATPFAISVGQVLFKISGDKLAKSQSSFVTLAMDPLFILALAIYGSATIIWVWVLKTVPLAYAYSFMAITFIMVPVLSWMILGEKIDLRYGIGTLLIITGLLTIHTG